MAIMSVDEAKTRLAELVEAAAAGEDVLITQNEDLAVQLVPRHIKKRKRQFGSAKGLISMRPDFYGPLEDFKEYRE